MESMASFLEWYQHIPEYIDPIAFSVGPVEVRWYSLMYIVGFFVVYELLRTQLVKSEKLKVESEKKIQNRAKKINSEKEVTNYKVQITSYEILDVLLWGMMGAVIGGRIGYVLFYDFGYFLQNPLEMFLPYSSDAGVWTGIYGMSFHGGLLGTVIITFLWVRYDLLKKISKRAQNKLQRTNSKKQIDLKTQIQNTDPSSAFQAPSPKGRRGNGSFLSVASSALKKPSSKRKRGKGNFQLLMYWKETWREFLRLSDFVVPAVPLGYFFGRIGNFLNGELYGRETSGIFGMYFDGVLRHPSQLYEAILEGFILFVLLWVISRKLRVESRKKSEEDFKFEMQNIKITPSARGLATPPWQGENRWSWLQIPGALLVMYIIGYAAMRFIGEFFRQPDVHLGFVAFGFLTMGQVLSIGMFLVGVWLFCFLHGKFRILK